MDTVKVLYEGEAVDAEQVQFTNVAPGVELLDIEDGTRITVTCITKTIFRLLHKRKENGDPIYVCTMVVNTVATVPQAVMVGKE